VLRAEWPPLGDRQAIGAGVELLGNVVGLAHQHDAALNWKSARVAHEDPQLSGGALTELAHCHEQGNRDRSHLLDSLT
jgi:hypothetical protein